MPGGKVKRDLLSDFFLRLEKRKDRHGLTHWKVKVHDYPILNHDKSLIESLYNILAELIHDGQLSTLLNLFDRVVSTGQKSQGMLITDRFYRTTLNSTESHTLSLIANALFSDFETPDKPVISDFETPVSRLISIFEPPVRQLISESATPVPVLFSDFETHLKILYMIKDSIKMIQDTNYPPDSDKPDDQSENKMAEDWDYQQILRSVNPDFRTKIIQEPGKQLDFVALLIQSCLNARVQQPLNLALSKTLQGGMIPDAAALRLAKQTPLALLSVLVMTQTDPNRFKLSTRPISSGYRCGHPTTINGGRFTKKTDINSTLD